MKTISLLNSNQLTNQQLVDVVKKRAFKKTLKQLKKYFIKINPTNWFEEFKEIKITLEEFESKKNNN